MFWPQCKKDKFTSYKRPSKKVSRTQLLETVRIMGLFSLQVYSFHKKNHHNICLRRCIVTRETGKAFVQKYPCSLQFSWNVWGLLCFDHEHGNLPLGMVQSTPRGANLISQASVRKHSLRIPTSLSNSYSHLSSCSETNWSPDPMSCSAGSNVCLCLLVLAFSLANLGDSYSLAWEREERAEQQESL